jgi:hypothetical protein
MHFATATPSPALVGGSLPRFLPLAGPAGALRVQVLKSPAERRLIAGLREHADCGPEYELDPGMVALESKKDAIGTVLAICEGADPIATIRCIPSGHGVTLAERLWGHVTAGTEIVGANSWEVGRLVMAPEHRRGDLFPLCMALLMTEFVELEKVEHFHGTCAARMTRLYRRMGFGVVGTTTSTSGKESALIHARVQDVARALHLSVDTPAAVLQ